MNMNSLINMFGRMLTRRAMNWGINKGISTISKARGGQAGAQAGKPAATSQQNKALRENAKRARQAARITRKIGR